MHTFSSTTENPLDLSANRAMRDIKSRGTRVAIRVLVKVSAGPFYYFKKNSQKTNYGKQVSINLDKKDEIMKYIDEFLKME